MGSLLTDPDFWSALSNFAWPVVAAVVLYRFHPLVAALLQRDNMQIKVGGLELSVQDAAKAHGKNIVEIQQRLAAIEANSTISQNFTSENEGRENINRKDRSILWVDDFPSNNAFLVRFPPGKERRRCLVVRNRGRDGKAKIQEIRSSYNRFG